MRVGKLPQQALGMAYESHAEGGECGMPCGDINATTWQPSWQRYRAAKEFKFSRKYYVWEKNLLRNNNCMHIIQAAWQPHILYTYIINIFISDINVVSASAYLWQISLACCRLLRVVSRRTRRGIWYDSGCPFFNGGFFQLNLRAFVTCSLLRLWRRRQAQSVSKTTGAERVPGILGTSCQRAKLCECSLCKVKCHVCVMFWVCSASFCSHVRFIFRFTFLFFHILLCCVQICVKACKQLLICVYVFIYFCLRCKLSAFHWYSCREASIFDYVLLINGNGCVRLGYRWQNGTVFLSFSFWYSRVSHHQSQAAHSWLDPLI